MRHKDFSFKTVKERPYFERFIALHFGEAASADLPAHVAAQSAKLLLDWCEIGLPTMPNPPPFGSEFARLGWAACVRFTGDPTTIDTQLMAWARDFLDQLLDRAGVALVRGDPQPLIRLANQLAEARKQSRGQQGEPLRALLLTCLTGSTAKGWRQTRFFTVKEIQGTLKAWGHPMPDRRTVRRAAREMGVNLKRGEKGRPRKSGI
jgi:hypothetical protein